MRRAVKLFCMGVLPLPIGFLLNYYILLGLPLYGFSLIGAALLAAWGYMAFRVSDAGKSPMVQAFLLSAFGLLMLVLAVYQELVLGHYWPNRIGSGTQMYFLPFLSLALSVMGRFFSRIWPGYIAVWLAIFFASWAGCRAKRGKQR